MRAVIQRVLEASVTVEGNKVSEIGKGMLVLLGVEKNDGQDDFDYIVRKISEMRIFDDADGRINLSVQDIQGEILLVSQFTLCADLRKGRRPDFFQAEKNDIAEKVYLRCMEALRSIAPVKCGVFGADMKVMLVNDGPFTVLLDSHKKF